MNVLSIGALLTLSPRFKSARLYLWIILRIGFSVILCSFGSMKSCLIVVFFSLNPSFGVTWSELCFGTLLILANGFGRPVELRQLIDGSYSRMILLSGLRRYSYSWASLSSYQLSIMKARVSLFSKIKPNASCNLPTRVCLLKVFVIFKN